MKNLNANHSLKTINAYLSNKGYSVEKCIDTDDNSFFELKEKTEEGSLTCGIFYKKSDLVEILNIL